MTKEAFETINEGLQEALEVARGEVEPYRLHERGGYTMTPEEYERKLKEKNRLIFQMMVALKDSNRANQALAEFQARHGRPKRHELFERVNTLLEQARKELE